MMIDKKELFYLSQSMGFRSEILEKVIILTDLLKSFHQHSIKGGTAINLFFKEAKIRRGQTSFQSTVSTVVLVVIQHPEYQIGRLSARFADHTGEHSKIPILREHLSGSLKSKLEHSVGTSFLAISLFFARRVGYSYQLIMTINRIPLSQINQLFDFGRAFDPVTRLIGIRIDELGIIEKEAMIQWLSGLGIHIAMTGGRAIVPAIFGYTAATACREIAGRTTERALTYYGASQQTTTFLKTAVHVAAYTKTYFYGVRFGLWLRPIRPVSQQTLSRDEAFEELGLSERVSKEDIKERCRELSRKYHPDKCRTVLCRKELGEGYEPKNCETLCQASAERMVRINRTCEVLKIS